MMIVGAVFVYSPAAILSNITGSVTFWIVVIFVYYLIATLLPIKNIIGRIYPLFAASLLFMAVALLVVLLVKWPTIPEVWEGLGNKAMEVSPDWKDHIFPCLFIVISCGAISGFHATQSPLMARCIKDEKLGRPVFYGAMITEGIVALIWAAISSYFFYDGGAAAVGSDLSAAAPVVVGKVSMSWLGVLGGVLALLGVVAAPITSGDTAFRSARLIIADFLKLDQKPIRNRILICIPLFLVVSGMLAYYVADADGFNVVWRYFGWANQTLAVFSLWTVTVYLALNKKGLAYLIGMIPAAFMTAVCLTYILIAKIGFNLPDDWNWSLGISIFFLSIVNFLIWKYCRKA